MAFFVSKKNDSFGKNSYFRKKIAISEGKRGIFRGNMDFFPFKTEVLGEIGIFWENAVVSQGKHGFILFPPGKKEIFREKL